MQQKMGLILRIAVTLCLLACTPNCLLAQAEGELTAKVRLFPTIGPGLRAVRLGSDGRTYVLASPSPGLLVLDAKGKQVLAIAESPADSKASSTGMVFGEDCDVDAEGRIYVADRGTNSVEVFGPDGALLRSMQVPAPISVAAIGEGEVAVATLREPHLVIVFDKNGRDVREFGDPEQISQREDLNRFLNIGELAADAQGHVYYAFNYSPEPTVRLYDRNGYGAGGDIQYLALEAAPAAQAIRREIVQQEKHRKSPSFKRLLTAVGVDRANGEVWMAVGGDTLLHFDKDGNRRASYLIYTPQGTRLEASTILVERDRLIIGSDPLGIYEFERPDKNPR
jgi:hypothetical protein